MFKELFNTYVIATAPSQRQCLEDDRAVAKADCLTIPYSLYGPT